MSDTPVNDAHSKSSTKREKVVIITGLSGAGKSIAINSLEDLGYYCIDNLPLPLIDEAISYFLKAPHLNHLLALGLDSRTPSFVEDFKALQKRLRKKIDLQVLFLSCRDERLAERFSTTRRKHPILDQGGELLAAIRRETANLSAVEEVSDVVFDTSDWTPHYLSRQVEEHFAAERKGRSLYVTVTSFGFKHGQLKPADTIFDVRFLRNPHFYPEFKPRTGLEKDVRDYVFSDPNSDKFLDHLADIHGFLLPEYYREGKHYFRIGIGCTGGKHRSVAMAEALAFRLAEKDLKNIYVSASHRDVDARPSPLHTDR